MITLVTSGAAHRSSGVNGALALAAAAADAGDSTWSRTRSLSLSYTPVLKRSLWKAEGRRGTVRSGSAGSEEFG